MKVRTLFVLVFATICSGCTDTIPEFEGLDPSQLPRPLFSGKTINTMTLTSLSENLLISGECDSRVSGLKAQIIGFKKWDEISEFTFDPFDSDCKDEKFSFSLKSLSQMGFNPSSQFSLNLELKSVTVAGDSLASTVTLIYIPAGKSSPPGMHISSSGGVSSSASYVVKSSVKFSHNNNQSSASYILKTGQANHAP